MQPVPIANLPGESLSNDRYTPGEVLVGKYRLVNTLAVGGMGTVWRAHNQLLEADVAVKLMFRSASDAGGVALERARTEAQLAAQLTHPAVCATLDFGVSGRGDPFVVSELLHGQGLDQALFDEGTLSATRAAQLLLPVLDGLGVAHAKGILHRDVKPSNIFLARVDGGSLQPKLLDFGIARDLSNNRRVTATGTVCGTPDYMSPEQARGIKDLDHRSDIWNVCATLYELVSGRTPFEAENYNALMYALIDQEPAPLTELPQEDRELQAIIYHGLQKDRAHRFQSTRELADHLSRFLLARDVHVDICGHSLGSRLGAPESGASRAKSEWGSNLEPSGPRHRPAEVLSSRLTMAQGDPVLTRRIGLIAVGVASLLGLAGWGLVRGSNAPPELVQEVALPSNELPQSGIENTVLLPPTLAPQGSDEAEVVSGPAPRSVATMDAPTRPARVVPRVKEVVPLAISPSVPPEPASSTEVPPASAPPSKKPPPGSPAPECARLRLRALTQSRPG